MGLIQHKALRGVNLHPVGFVAADANSLPSASEQEPGTAAYVTDTGGLYISNGTIWKLALPQTVGEIHLSSQGMIIPAMNGAGALEQVDADTTTSFIVSEFAKTAGVEYGIWTIPVPQGFSGATIEATVRGWCDGGSGDAVLGIDTEVIRIGDNITNAGFGTAETGVMSMTLGEMAAVDIVDIPVGECAAGDILVIRLLRDGGDELDTLNETIYIAGLTVRYARAAEGV